MLFRTISNFVPSPPPLNPEHLKLYDIVKDRQAMICEKEGSQTSRWIKADSSKSQRRPVRLGYHNDAIEFNIENCFARCQPHRFSAILPKALDSMSMVKDLGKAFP